LYLVTLSHCVKQVFSRFHTLRGLGLTEPEMLGRAREAALLARWAARPQERPVNALSLDRPVRPSLLRKGIGLAHLSMRLLAGLAAPTATEGVRWLRGLRLAGRRTLSRGRRRYSRAALLPSYCPAGRTRVVRYARAVCGPLTVCGQAGRASIILALQSCSPRVSYTHGLCRLQCAAQQARRQALDSCFPTA
jgi:hypothetical protein